MPVFEWVGKNRAGAIQKGELEASNLQAVKAHLGRIRVIPIRIKKKPKDIFENISFFKPKVTEKDIILFTRQFSTMVDAGIPIIQSLDILIIQQENKTFKKILEEIKESVESGATLADSFKKFPKLFDDVFINMLSAGETGGVLDTIFRRLSAYMEKTARLKSKIKGAMTYPMVTMIVAILVLAVILVFVIPVFQQMFSDFGRELPLPTRIVIAMSELVKNNIHYILGAMLVFILAFTRFYKHHKGRLIVDTYLLKMPVIGMLIRKIAIAKFSRTMGTLLGCGVAILEALDISLKTAGNKIIEKALTSVRTSIIEGHTIASPLSESNVFPPMVSQMISVGETTGALDSMLSKIADFYDEEVDQAVENLTSLIEPVMIVVWGVLIGGLVIAMYLPVFEMAKVVTG